jgi:hypothetical protein
MKVDPRPDAPAIQGASTDRTPVVEALRPLQPRAEQRFEALLNRREVGSRRSLKGELQRSAASDDVSAQLFSPARSVQVLRYLLAEVLPTLDAEPQIKALAEQLLEEEIDTRQWLDQQRLNEVPV